MSNSSGVTKELSRQTLPWLLLGAIEIYRGDNISGLSGHVKAQVSWCRNAVWFAKWNLIGRFCFDVSLPWNNTNNAHFERFTVPPNRLTMTCLTLQASNPEDFHVISQSQISHRKHYVNLPPWLELTTITKSARNKTFRIRALICFFTYSRNLDEESLAAQKGTWIVHSHLLT